MKAAGQNELARTYQRFLDWAHTMGWRYNMMPFHLKHFARFLERRGVERFEDVDTTLLIEYQQSLSVTRSPSTVNSYLTTLRALWRYLQREDLVTRDVTKGAARLRPHQFVPHLYTERELSRIEQGAKERIRQARSPGHRFCRRTRQAAFGLLRDCGLRVSEACRLNVNDYDPRARSLRIDRTKFFKTRVIPLPRSTCMLLDHYMEHRRGWLSLTTESPALFVSMLGQKLGRGALERPFKQLLGELALYRPRRRESRTVFGSTNLHALRHSYAVRTLERWQRQGRNTDHLLPLLSAIMGHVKVTYTTHYLHLTPLLRQLANERFGKMALPLLDHSNAVTGDE